MKLEQSFEVTAPLERVWAALIDVERVAPCLPGAAVTGRNPDGSYDGSFQVKIGPTAAAYTGKLRMEQVDEDAHIATMDAQGTDRRGQGGAKATIISSVTPLSDSRTRVEVSTDYHITGRLARFGRGGMIEEISNRLLREFAGSLQEMVAAGVPAGVEAAAVEEAAASELAAVVPEAAPESELACEAPVAAGPPEPPSAPEPPTAAPAPEPPTAAPAPEPEPIQGLSLAGAALWSRAKRNPVPLAALVIGFLVALRVLRRRG